MARLSHQTQPDTAPVTSDGLRRNQIALEAMIAAASAAGVITFNTRSGAVTLLLEDVRQALGVTYATNALKVLRVNSGETGFELATPSGGSSSYTYATTAVSYTETATSGEKIVTVTATGQTVTLPTAVGNTAKLTFKFATSGSLIIDGAGTETIDGGLTATLTMQYEAITLISDGTGWRII